MNNFAIVFSTSEKYLAQAFAMYEQLCIYSLEKYAWVVPLEALRPEYLESLNQRFDERVTETLQILKNLKFSANKIFLPRMIPKAKKYILIDTDILILKREFIDTFLEYSQDSITLVESTFSWQDWLSKCVSSQQKLGITQFPNLLNKVYVQTGSIGISARMYNNIFDRFVSELLDEDPKHRGDLMIWNDWVSRYPQFFSLVPSQTCLVLRPDGSGSSSKLHIPYLSYENDILFYPNLPVMALHFTSSKGIAKTWKDYQQFMKKLFSTNTDNMKSS